MRLATACVSALLAAGFLAEPVGRGAEPAAVVGIDHVPVAVADLPAAASTYRRLGFALKPGRPHANGIENQHVKFPDGTEIELITAPKAADSLTRTYRRHLAAGDGPAFLALFTRSTARTRTALSAAGFSYSENVWLSLSPDKRVPYIFFGPRQASPTDRPEHFAHANTADSLVSVWLAGDDLAAERALLQALGARMRDSVIDVPEPTRATIAEFDDGRVVLLPGRFRRVAGRPIVGVTVRVRDAARARLVPPEAAHGLWLDLRHRP
jgi:hypothetical protein